MGPKEIPLQMAAPTTSHFIASSTPPLVLELRESHSATAIAVGMVGAYWKRHGSLDSQLKAVKARVLTIAAEM